MTATTTPTAPPQLPATLADAVTNLRKIVADRERADLPAAQRHLRAAWQHALEAAQRVLPVELFPQLPNAYEVPEEFATLCGRVCDLRFTFAGRWPVVVRFIGSRDGLTWTWAPWNVGEYVRLHDPLDILRKGPLYLVERPGGSVACPDLASALDAAEIGGGVVTDDDGEA